MTLLIARITTAAVIGASPLIFAHPSPAATTDVAGTWVTEDGRARVRTERCGPQDDHLCGFIVWVRKPLDETGRPRTDGANPDPRKASRPILGHQMILGLKQTKDGPFEGRIYNADNGKTYDVSIRSESPGDLTVEGCMLAILCGSQSWKRTTDVLPGQLDAPTNTPGGPRSDPEWAKPGAVAGSAPAIRPRAATAAR